MKPFKIPLLKINGYNTGKMKRGYSYSKEIMEDGSVIRKKVDEAHITIFRGRYEEESGTSHPLRTVAEGKMYFPVTGLNYDGYRVYCFKTFGAKSNKSIHVGMTWKQRQKFHWMQGDHWFQKEENIRYVVNILFLLLGASLTIKSLFFN